MIPEIPPPNWLIPTLAGWNRETPQEVLALVMTPAQWAALKEDYPAPELKGVMRSRLFGLHVYVTDGPHVPVLLEQRHRAEWEYLMREGLPPSRAAWMAILNTKEQE